MPLDQNDEGSIADETTGRTRCLSAVLRMSGLRPTRQRLSLLALIMHGQDRHFTIDELYDEARRADLSLSLATVYNATRQFGSVGILRELPVDGNRTYYDTNTRDHRHYFLEEEQRLLDVPADAGTTSGAALPPGTTVHRVDVLIHLRKTNPGLLVSEG